MADYPLDWARRKARAAWALVRAANDVFPIAIWLVWFALLLILSRTVVP